MTQTSLNPHSNISEEFEGVDLPEQRLEERLRKIVPVLESHPDATFPQGFANDNDLAGFYRFVENDRIDPDSLLETHTERTAERTGEADEVYLISDSSMVIRERPDAEEKFLNVTDTKYGFGLHTVLAATAPPRAVPFGVLSMEIFEPAPFDKAVPEAQRRTSPKRPMLRWIRGIDRSTELLKQHQLSGIHVMDREADSYEIWSHLAELDQRAIIRSRFDRNLVAQPDGSQQKLRQRVAEAPVQGTLEVDLAPRRHKPGTPPTTVRRYPNRTARTATVELRVAPVRIPRPANAPKDCPEVMEVWAVSVREPNPPEGDEPIDWLLLANYPVTTLREALAVVDAYRGRWVIEDFHKVLKTGCRLEDRQLQSVETFEPTLRLFTPIAWKLLLASRLARKVSPPPASVVFDDYELTALRILSRRKRRPLPARLSTRRAYKAIAKLGGWIEKPNRPAGWIVLSRGMKKVQEAAELLREVGIDSPPP